MPPPAMSSAEPSGPAGPSGTWQTLGRHQVGAFVATAVDFSIMVLCVERLGLAPVAATAIGASVGAFTNFMLARAWIFRRHEGHWAEQAIRYVLVSGGGAGWNTLGEHLMHDIERVQYVFARALVSVAVSLLWSFPMQRRFVFREGRAV
jgi:putative flippase GtrA